MSAIGTASLKRRLRRPPLRVQLTALYAGLFVLLVAAVLAVSGLLVRQGSTNGSGVSTSHNALFGHHLDLGPAIVAVIAGVVAVGLGWWIAGRFLRPLRAMNAAAREISATDLHRRLGLDGPDDELSELGQTLDDLFGRLEASFEAQRHFVANASHELRTPLAGLQTLLEVALADPNPDADTDTLRSVCQEALTLSQHQQRLIQALLTLATSERGVEQWEPLDLAQIAETVLAQRSHEAERRGIHIDATLVPARSTGDPRLVELLLTNLVDNALRHNTTTGQMEVLTIAAQGRSTITVSNTGPTIPPDEVERLFRPFQQRGRERVRHADGHGLGLAIVQAIAQAHRAKITARPRPEGGLDIDVSFPPSQATDASNP
jgi:signal transduction histidine kinase